MPALDQFRELGEEVKRRNILHKLFITGRDDNFDREHLFEWLGDKNTPVTTWKDSDRTVLYDLVRDKKVEIAATHPPTLVCHGLKVRFCHKKKQQALEYICDSSGMTSKVAWVSQLVDIDREKPVDDLVKFAESWALKIFSGVDLEGKGKKQPVKAILRKSVKRTSLIFPP